MVGFLTTHPPQYSVHVYVTYFIQPIRDRFPQTFFLFFAEYNPKVIGGAPQNKIYGLLFILVN